MTTPNVPESLAPETLVIKFGGAALASVAAMRSAAHLVRQHHDAGERVIIVVSAMKSETDRLTALCDDAHVTSDHRDRVLATGESVSAALFAGILREHCALNARAFEGWQIPIVTDDRFGQAMITEIETSRLKEQLDDGCIPVITGFQGVSRDTRRITTLGRGGTDITAAAVARAIKAEALVFYKDVPAIYSANPQQVSGAVALKRIPLADLQELSSEGAQVLHPRAIKLLRDSQVRPQVRSFLDAPLAQCNATTFDHNYNPLEHPVISGLVCDACNILMEVKLKTAAMTHFLTVLDTLHQQGRAFDLMFNQGHAQESSASAPLLPARNTHETHEHNLRKSYLFLFSKVRSYELEQLTQELEALSCVDQVTVNTRVAKLVIVGSGLRQHHYIIYDILRIAHELGVVLMAINALESKVTLVISNAYARPFLQKLHDNFFNQESRDNAES